MKMFECKHFIAGKPHDGRVGTKLFSNIAPANDQVLCEVPLGGAEEIDEAVRAAQDALQGPWGAMSLFQRAHILELSAVLLHRNLEEFARLESLDTGKPISETKFGDIQRAVENLRFFADLAKHQPNQSYQDHRGHWHRVFREPLGVVGLITPWNLPLYLATWKLAPALVQGNTVVLKPAELTPMTAYRLAQLMHEAGLPPGVFNVVQGHGPSSAGESLVKHPGVRAISFTGETGTGKAIMAAAAPSLKKLSFELGGKGATYIADDGDLAQAVPTSVRAAFRNQGQICLAGSRLIVHRKVADQVRAKVIEEMQKICIGDPLQPETTMGSLISKEHRSKVMSFVSYAGEMPGHQILAGGNIPSSMASGAYFAPTFIEVEDQQSRLIQEEIFGPVLTMQICDSDQEAMAYLNGTRYGLSCAIWSRDLDRAQKLASQARMGLVWINTWFSREFHTPFGGMKESGIGREGGQYSLDFFSDFKTVSVPESKP